MQTTPEIKMLDWTRTLAGSGAACLHEHLMSGGLAGSCAILVPGRRVRRRVQNELLDLSIRSGAAEARESPRVLTASVLIEAFLESNSTLRPVDDSISIVFWAEAFRTLGRDAGLLLGRGGADDSLALSRVGTLRQVCEELDAIGRTPEDVLEAGIDVG